MLFIECYGKNVYIDDELVGYISPTSGDMYADGHKFGNLTPEGDIYLNNEWVGYIEDNLDIYINEQVAGCVTPQNDIKFDSAALKQIR